MIGTLDVECQAKNPNLPLAPMTAFINSPSSLRIRNVPKRIGDWCIRNVYVTCVYPDSSIQSVQCVLVGGIWVGTIQGTATSGTSKNGYTIFADGTDENGNNVTGYVLGKGDIEILEADGTLSPDPARYTVKLLSAEATQPREGDMYPTDDGYVIWQDGEAHLLGTPFEQISAYVESTISAKADLSTLEDYIPYTIDSSGYKTAITIGTRTPDSSVGQYSFSTGVNNAAEAMQTVAMGFNNKTQVQNSIAIGQYNTVAGNPAVAIGKSNKVSCTNGVSIGDTNTISGVNAVAIGTMNNANGKYAIAMGGKARANSDGSFTWSGSDKVNIAIYPQYFDHGKGTFNVNPAGGLSGFYIGEQSLNDILSAKADLSVIPSNTSQLSNDSGFITSAEIEPYHEFQSPTENTGLARMAMFLGTTDESLKYDDSGYFNAIVKFNSQNVDPYISLNGNYIGFWPWTLTQFFGTTYSPALQLVWWKGSFNRLRAGRYTKVYYGFMWRTKGIGFAIPCSEDGIPDGRLFEITKVEETSPYRISNSGSENHTITGNQDWSSIETIDGQTNQIVCTRAVILKNKTYVTSFASKDDLPTKTSELSNDSGFIQQNGMAVIHDLTCDQLVVNQAYIAGYATESDLSSKAEVSAVHGDYIQDSVGNKIQADGQISAISTYYTVVAFHSDTLGDFTVENDGVWQNERSNAFITAGLAEGMWDISAVSIDIGGELKNGIGYFSTSDAEVVWTEGDLVGDQSIAVNVERQAHHATIVGTLATQNWVLEQLSALEARIAALEGN